MEVLKTFPLWCGLKRGSKTDPPSAKTNDHPALETVPIQVCFCFFGGAVCKSAPKLLGTLWKKTKDFPKSTVITLVELIYGKASS